MIRFAKFTAIAVVAFCGSAVLAVASSPQLTLILPRGAQRGTEAELTFSGARLDDTEEIFFYTPGFEVAKIEPVNANAIKATIKIAADCRLGEHTAQLRTKSGISEYRTFFVGALPAIDEKEPNTEFAQPQPIELNVTVHGVIQNEDVDYFSIEAKKGQRISVEVEGMRFGQTMFDPYIGVLDSKRFELVAVDDSPLLRQDAATSFIAPEDGTYIVEIREAAYGGDGNCRYCVHIGTFPRPTAVFPAGGKLGEEIEVRFIGDASGDIVQKIKLPAEQIAEHGLFAQDDTGIAPSDNPFRLSDHPNAFEVEPNNSHKEATPVAFPAAFNGILQDDGDIDHFRFTMTKDQEFEVECYGRRIRSAIDPVMYVYDAAGKNLAGNDDSRGPDSYFRFKAPADGDYVLRINDHLARGGAEFVYRVEFQPISASLTLGIPRVARYSQSRQQIYIPRGNRFGTIISASRANFSGDLVLAPEGLPEGITMIASPMPGNQNTMPVVFEVAPDAKLSGRLVNFLARHADPNQKISGGFTNRADFVISAPGQSLYSWKDVDRLAFAVIDELPYSIEIVQPKVPIVRDGSMNLKIIAKKKEGWDEEITLEFPYRPPGVGAGSSVKIPKGQTECVYPLSANGGAAIGAWPVYAIASANVNGSAWAASQMATLEIVEPFVSLALQRSNVEQGKETEVACTVELKQDFAGSAKVELVGLPHKVVTEPMEITKDSKEVVFKVKTEADSPEGTHKNIFCRVTVTANEEPIVHARVGATELRIDKPLPPKVAPPPMPVAEVAKKPEPPKPPTEKRLSRLEQLRLDAKQRGSGAGSEE